MQHLTEREFDEKYTTVTPPSGETYWEFHEIVSMDLDNVWTAVDGDDGSIWLNPGISIVNRIGHIVTEEKHNWNEEVHWYDPEEYE